MTPTPNKPLTGSNWAGYNYVEAGMGRTEDGKEAETMRTIEKRNGKFYIVTWRPWGETFGQPVQQSVEGPFVNWHEADAAFYDNLIRRMFPTFDTY